MKPTVEYLRECFDMDSERGTLTWRKRPRNHFATDKKCESFNKRNMGKQAAHKYGRGYLRAMLDGMPFLVHHLIWAMTHGTFSTSILDHIDGNKKNNAPSNLRECTQSQNNRNVPGRNPLGLKGVQRVGRKFRAAISFEKKQRYLGTYNTVEEAHLAYCAAAKKYHGEFANLTIARPTGGIS